MAKSKTASMVSLKQFFPEIKILTSLSEFANSERCSEASRLLNKWNYAKNGLIY